MENEQSPYDNGQFCHGKMNNGQWTMDNGQNGQWTFSIENHTFDNNFWYL